jgi:phosphoribosylformylglycinamidine (FGAM) synthase-like amidotransferase family enzyme
VPAGRVLRIPIGHGEGNYFAPPEMLRQIEANRQVVFRYTDPQGRLDEMSNPNGSVNAIAGLCSEARNVVGMMPHPERACEALLGGVDGRAIFESVIGAFRSAERPALQPSGVGSGAGHQGSAGNERSASLSGGRSR